MPIDPQCDDKFPGSCDSEELIGKGLIVEEGCPKICIKIKKNYFIDEDGEIYNGQCDDDVEDIMIDATSEINVYFISKTGTELYSENFMGYAQNGPEILNLLVRRDGYKALPGDIIEHCGDITEKLYVIEVGADGSLTVQRGWDDSGVSSWPSRSPVKIYRIFRKEMEVDSEDGTLCYQWTRSETSTPGEFGAFAELQLADGDEKRFPKKGAFKIIFN
jgi:hypothetical protein